MNVKFLLPLFERWKISLPEGAWAPRPATDDFGLEVTALLLSAETQKKELSPIKSAAVSKPIWEGISFINTFQNLKSLESALGITFKEAGHFYYVRDSFLRLHDGSIRSIRHSNNLDVAVERARSSNLYLDKTATTHTRNQLFNHWSGFGGRYFSESQADLNLHFSEASSPFDYAYVEGGNVFTLTDGEGQVHVLVGEDHRLQTLMTLELEGHDWSLLAVEAGLGSFSGMAVEIGSNLSEGSVYSLCEEMYSLGLLCCQGQTGLINQKSQLNLLLSNFFMAKVAGKVISEDERGWYRSLAERGGLVKPFQIGEDKMDVARIAAAGYQAKLKVVHALIAKDFHVQQERLHFIAQANYHLDAFMAPGPQHSVFLVDYAFCADLIKELIDQREFLELSDGDLFYLTYYFETAKKFDQEFGEMIRRVEKQLRAAGFTVVPMPGHFLYEPLQMYEEFPMPSEGFCINFVNSISGWSQKANSFYYITHGLHVGEKVGVLLMDSFSAFLQSYIPNIQVYFVGFDPKSPGDFSEGLDFWNRLETQSGVHCVTFPLCDL